MDNKTGSLDSDFPGFIDDLSREILTLIPYLTSGESMRTDENPSDIIGSNLNDDEIIELLLENKDPVIHNEVSEICETYLHCAGFIVSPFNDLETLRKFLDTHPEACNVFTEFNDKLRSLLTNEKSQLDYLYAVTGKFDFNGAPAGYQLTQGRTEPLSNFLQGYPEVRNFLSSEKTLDAIWELSQKYQAYVQKNKALDDIIDFLKDHMHFKLFSKLFDSEWREELNLEREDKLNTKNGDSKLKTRYPFALHCLSLISHYYAKLKNEFEKMEAIITSNKNFESVKGKLVTFFHKNPASLQFWHTNMPMVAILSAILHAQKNRVARENRRTFSQVYDSPSIRNSGLLFQSKNGRSKEISRTHRPGFGRNLFSEQKEVEAKDDTQLSLKRLHLGESNSQ